MQKHIDCVKDLITLNPVTGPFFTGSFMTWLLEIKYHNIVPSWLPDDLDICCTSEDQFQYVKNILQPLATTSKDTNWLGHSATYWMINNFKYQAFVHPVTVQERLNLIDYTVTAIASDGTTFITGKYTIEDIKNRVIRLNDNSYIWPFDSIMHRYKKYLSRGYVVLNNTTLRRLNQIYET